MYPPIRVLILEDYEDDSLLLLRELRRGGFEPSHLTIETEEAMQSALENNEWDIILSDYSMPSFNAPAALSLLKKSKKDIPFIVVSGNVGEEIAVKLMRHGAADYINKDSLSRLCPAILREQNEFKQRKKRLESEKITNRLWDIFNNSLNEIYVFYADSYEFIAVNEAALDNLGYSLPEMKAKHPWDIKVNFTEDEFKEKTKPVKNGEINSLYFETSHVRKDGTTYPVEIRLQLSTEETSTFYAVILDITERKKSTEKIESLARFPEENPQPIIRVNFDYEVIYCNPASNELIRIWDKSHRGKVPSVWKSAVNKCNSSNSYQYFEDSTNQRIYNWLLFPSKKGQYISCYGRDVTEQKVNENVLKQAYQVFENITEGIMICNQDDIITAINPAFSQITGFKVINVIGKNASLLNSEKDEIRFLPKEKLIVALEGKWQGELLLRKQDGEKTPVSLSISTIKNRGKIGSFIYVFSDIAERKLALEHIHNLSYYDPLTNIPNRLHVLKKLYELIEDAKLYQLNISIIYLNLNRFKTINEILGHQTADAALALVSQRLSTAIPQNAFLGRMGADEFVIIVKNSRIESDEHEIIETLTNVFKPSFELQGEEIYINATIGVSHYPENGSTENELIEYAELAVAHAKRQEKHIEIYSEKFHTRDKDHIKFETNLRKALERNEFELYYQPKIDLTARKIVGVEALIRWNHPTMGLILPSNFIPVLEETGLIIPVGNWVMEEACKQLKAWEKEGINDINIAVNLSGKQFNQNNLVKKILQIVKNTNINPAMIELEVTESTIMQRYEEVIETLKELHNQNFSISIDDFGTGYSSLAYLKHFPIDILKIDRSFVSEIPGNKDDTAIVNTIVNMGHSLNLKVIAEGVETIEQLDVLSEMGCELAQGFYISKPLPANEVFSLLKNKKIK